MEISTDRLAWHYRFRTLVRFGVEKVRHASSNSSEIRFLVKMHCHKKGGLVILTFDMVKQPSHTGEDRQTKPEQIGSSQMVPTVPLHRSPSGPDTPLPPNLLSSTQPQEIVCTNYVK